MRLPFGSGFKKTEERKRLVSIYEQYHTAMERIAMCILKSNAEVEDAVQNAFIRMICNFEKIYEIPCEKLRPWLITIVKYEALMLLRKRKPTVPLEELAYPEPRAEDGNGYIELVGLIRSMPETYRAVLELKLISGYTDAEIAERLGISETAVSSRASRGRKMLREILEKEGIYP